MPSSNETSFSGPAINNETIPTEKNKSSGPEIRPLTAKEQVFANENLGLVYKIAQQYRNCGADVEELIQEGIFGLGKAVQKFKPDLGYKFSTYAHWWIRQSMLYFIKFQFKTVRLPISAKTHIKRLEKAKEDLTHELKREPTEAELAKKLMWKIEKVRKVGVYTLYKTGVLLNHSKFEDEEMWVDNFKDPRAQNPEHNVISDEIRSNLRSALATLPKREFDIVNRHYGIGPDHYNKPMTLQKIGELEGVSGERIRQLKAQSLQKLNNIYNDFDRASNS